MTRKIGLILSCAAAFIVIAAGAYSYACDGSSCSSSAKKASNAGTSCSADAKSASTGGCCMSKGASAEKASAGGCCMGKGASADKATCAMKMAASSCGSKGYYAANVYNSKDGQMWAVAQGKKFEVSDKTPYTQVGNARYYFADDNCKISCQEKMKTASLDIDKETVSLATAEGNVIGIEDGKKIAQCRVSGEKFVVTADSPSLVMDGQKYYFCGAGCANMMKEGAKQSTTETSLNAQ